MKKITAVILCAVMTICCALPAFAADKTVIWDGSGEFSVAYNGGAYLGEIANKLASYVGRLTGTTPTPVEGSVADAGVNLCLDRSGMKYGSYKMKLEGRAVTITASDVRGAANGMYDFLHDYCGCSWYTQDVSVIPQIAEISVPAGLNRTYTPYFEYADTDWVSPRYEEFAVANGLNGTYSSISATYGGKVRYIGGFCHTLSTLYVPTGTYFSEHPEYFSYRTDEGKRISERNQLCLSNPDVLAITTAQALDIVRNNATHDGAINILSLTQDDNYGYCQCDKCQAIVDKYGGQQSGIMLWFVNQVADAIAAEGYDDIVVDTFAYQYTRQAPTGIKPRPNVCVRLCSIECCFAHALDDPTCSNNTAFMKDLRDWRDLSDRLYVWDYTTNYSQTLGIFPDFGVLQRNIQVFHEYNVVGLYEEGAYYMGACNTEFGDLRSYMLARLMKDPYCDIDAEREGFIKGFYGAAAPQISEFISFITRRAGNSGGHLGIGQSMRDTLHGVTYYEITRADELWEQALANTADDPAANARVKRSMICWRYWKAVNRVKEFSRVLHPIDSWSAANEQLYNDILDHGTTMYNEWSRMDSLKYDKFTTPDNWTNGDTYADFLNALLAFWNRLYALLFRIFGIFA